MGNTILVFFIFEYSNKIYKLKLIFKIHKHTATLDPFFPLPPFEMVDMLFMLVIKVAVVAKMIGKYRNSI